MRFDFINQTKKSKVFKIMLNVIIIIILFLNINAKDDVKMISNLNKINYFKESVKEELKEKKKEKAINLIKSYIPNYDNLINLKSSQLEVNEYSNDFNCLKRIINFNNLINIDYLDKNEDYNKNPIYQIIKHNLEIDYTEPNLPEEYNNKSKYFQREA
jgi:hypothetical protein